MLRMENSQGERRFSLILGIIFLFIGIAGFIPAFLSIPGQGTGAVPINAAPGLYSLGFGYLFGLFPTNFVHNIVHSLVGIAGIAASTDDRAARTFCRVYAYLYALLAVLGLIPFGRTLFGLMPIFGNNVWFNGLTALIAGYFGFVKPSTGMERPISSGS